MKPNEINSSNETTSNNKAVLDQNNVPIEELLGSTYNNVEGSDSKSQQLRTSARVFKKMKLDSAVVISVPVVSDNKKETLKEETKPEVKRPFRPTWSQEDKNLFFEALNEFGKDFEAIHSHITNKLRKKGLPDSVMKTKDQVRHFYYRTWHKISKHLKFSNDIKKIAQELYGLINYGELRKKVGSVSEKTCMKLNELIYRGAVAIRIKGKTVRVKTPMCRALRKLNQLDEKHDDLKLPTRINVELVPRDMTTWLRVQGSSQNPRVKASLPLQKRLSTLIKFLNCKWKSMNAAAYEEALMSSNSVTSDCVPERKVVEDNKAVLEPYLRLTPPPKANIEIPTVNLSEYLTSHSICLNALEERIGVKTPGEQLWVIKGGTRKGGTKRSRNESSSEKSSPTNQKQLSSTTNTDNNENCIGETDHIPSSVDEVVDEAVNTLLALQHNQEVGENVEEKNTEEFKMEICDDIKDVERKEEYINNLRNGWTSYTCGTLTVGELYLMYGSNSNLILEYSWDQPEKITPKVELEPCDISTEEKEANANNPPSTDSSVDVNASVTENGVPNKSIEDDGNLMGTLQRLLSIAKLHYRKNIVHCPCGHVCGNNKPNNSVRSKTGIAKTNKVITGEKSNSHIEDKTSSAEASTVTSSVLPIIIQSPVRQFSPMSVFRRPISPNIDSLRAQLDSIQRLKPRYCNRRGRRPRTKQVVVERRLPLLPNKIDNGRQIVQMNIISHEDISPTPRTIAPKIVNIDKTEHDITNSINILPANVNNTNNGTISAVNMGEGPSTFGAVKPDQNLVTIDSNVNLSLTSSNCNTIDITDNAVTPSRIGSPTSISNLLEMALNPQNDNMLNNQALENKDDGIASFVGLLSHDMTNTTPPTSPSRILKENDNHWLNSEVADFSLSSFLGHLESPMKPAQSSTSTASDDNHLSQDVDAQLQSLLTESSVDYMAKFADLAAQVVSDVKK